MRWRDQNSAFCYSTEPQEYIERGSTSGYDVGTLEKNESDMAGNGAGNYQCVSYGASKVIGAEDNDEHEC